MPVSQAMCYGSSSEGYACTDLEGHTGPCSRVLWRSNRQHKRVFWWPGQSASETLDFLSWPKQETETR